MLLECHKVKFTSLMRYVSFLVIRPGSGAAADVSISDMNKRASLNQVKKQMLKNLNIFISPTRLCVHNLPPTFSDTKLRKLFVKHAGPGAKITEVNYDFKF